MAELAFFLGAVAFTLLSLTFAQANTHRTVHKMSLDFSKLKAATDAAVAALQGEAARQKAAVDDAVASAVAQAVATERAAQAASEASTQAEIDAAADALAKGVPA